MHFDAHIFIWFYLIWFYNSKTIKFLNRWYLSLDSLSKV